VEVDRAIKRIFLWSIV